MGKNILIVEDNKSLQMLYQMELKNEGYNVVSVNNCENALKILENDQIDLVILDLIFPDETGVDIISRMLDINGNLKLIINTGYPTFKMDFRSWIADAFLIKSSDLSELKSNVSKVLKAA